MSPNYQPLLSSLFFTCLGGRGGEREAAGELGGRVRQRWERSLDTTSGSRSPRASSNSDTRKSGAESQRRHQQEEGTAVHAPSLRGGTVGLLELRREDEQGREPEATSAGGEHGGLCHSTLRDLRRHCRPRHRRQLGHHIWGKWKERRDGCNLAATPLCHVDLPWDLNMCASGLLGFLGVLVDSEMDLQLLLGDGFAAYSSPCSHLLLLLRSCFFRAPLRLISPTTSAASLPLPLSALAISHCSGEKWESRERWRVTRVEGRGGLEEEERVSTEMWVRSMVIQQGGPSQLGT